MPEPAELVPFDRYAQRLTERQLAAAIAGDVTLAETRPIVRESWQRSLAAAVHPGLPAAPVAYDGYELDAAREREDWLPFARRAVTQLSGGFRVGHVLSMFDGVGRMLSCEGDTRAVEGLAQINFRPGGLWSEEAVGTNGPGTALVTNQPVHIVGAEHFCERVRGWHCAAVPIRDQVTGAPVGALDLSGFREFAHPHTLDLVIALSTTVEEMLAARDVERRYRVLHRLLDLAARAPTAALVAVDRAGRVLFATGPVPAGLRPETVTPPALRSAMADAVRAAPDASARAVSLALHPDAVLEAICHPVLDDFTAVGACFELTGGLAVPRRAPVTGGRTDAPRGESTLTRYSFLDLVGQSPELAEACRVAAAAASNTLPVLITGESGTGKEVFAQSIHRASARRDEPFVAVNCAALPRELVESELFGYVGGAFSGARREGSAGKFAAAHGGTIFLDEVGELPPMAQAALLRVLQEGELTPVGSARSRPVDVRVIAATNRPIRESLASGQLRSDLYYRLNVLSMQLPPLRDRRGDVALLAQRFLEGAEADLGRVGHAFGPGVMDAFVRYGWPGNVRELKNLVRRLVALCPGSQITLADLPAELRAAALSDAASGSDDDAALSGAVAAVLDTGDPERRRTLAAVTAAHTMAEAAQSLGITRSTLYRRLARYGVHTDRVVRAD